jgi:type II secretory pathway pseudopilin PulG
MSRLANIRRDESGAILVLAIAVLAVLLLVSTAAVLAAVHLKASATRQRNETAALAAAQAGLDVATYRLNQNAASLTSSKCLGTSGTSVVVTSPTVESNTFCTPIGSAASSVTGPSMGGYGGSGPTASNNPTYQYWDSIPLSSGSCGNLSVGGTTGVIQRCVVSVGYAGGVTRRLVELLDASAFSGTGSYSGITALGGFSLTENGKGSIVGYPTQTDQVPLKVNSPGTLTMKSCSPTPSVLFEPGPGATISGGDSSCNSGITTQSPAASTSWPTISMSTLDPYFDGTAENSGDTSISSNNDNSTLTAAGFTLDSNRLLKDAANTPLTLSGTNPRSNSNGIYVFNICGLTFTSGNTQITLLNGAKMLMLIDSHSRTVNGSPACPTTVTTPVAISNMAGWNYSATSTTSCNYPPGTPGDPNAMSWLVYGGDGTGTLTFSNQYGFSGLLLAPNWKLKLTGGGGCRSVVWYGSIATNDSMTMTNGLDFHGETSAPVGSSGSQTSVFAHHLPNGFAECSDTSSFSTSSPDQSC